MFEASLFVLIVVHIAHIFKLILTHQDFYKCIFKGCSCHACGMGRDPRILCSISICIFPNHRLTCLHTAESSMMNTKLVVADAS